MYNIIAICGASATGKSTLARSIEKELKEKGYNAGIIVSNTTRPPREEEVDGKDYHFCSSSEFLGNGKISDYLEYTSFRGWSYGTPRSALKYDINIGVFNPDGVRQLKNNSDVNLYIVYLKDVFLTRFLRSISRENKIKFEYIRRAITDRKDFKEFDDYLTKAKSCVIIEDIDNISTKANIAVGMMEVLGIFEGKLR